MMIDLELDNMTMREIEELVYDAIEAGAKTDGDVLAYVRGFVEVDLETVQTITAPWVNEWM